MKDKISHVHPRAVPYAATPRRPLHAESGTFASRSVRQANPACSLPQYLPPGTFNEQCNEYIGTVECVPALRAFYVQSSGDSANSDAQYFTCAKIACDSESPNIQKAPLIQYTFGGRVGSRPNDTRCFIAIPPEEFTHPVIGGAWSGLYRNIPGTVAHDIGSISGSRAPGVVHDVDNALCFKGFSDKAVAREIQQEIGITAALGATGIAACLLPAQTAAIAASAQATAVTGLAVGLGLFGSAVVIGGAGYAGYKMVQHYKLKNEVAPSTELLYSNQEDTDLNENIIVSSEKVLESPFERPFAD